jgi:hypothetical protein
MNTIKSKNTNSRIKSEYGKLKMNGLTRGRPRLSEKEKADRKILTAKRQEARRRAIIVLQRRHSEEYEKIFAKELKALS